MTVTDLMTALKALVEECVKDIVLPCRPEKAGAETTYRPARVYLMDLPKKTDDLNLIPYIILQVLTGQDEQKPGDDPHSQVGVRFAVGVYCDNMGEGKLNVLNIMGLATSYSAILSALIFNAVIIPCLIPLAMRGVTYKPMRAEKMLARNMLIYGLGGVIAPFVGIKLIDLIIAPMLAAMGM